MIWAQTRFSVWGMKQRNLADVLLKILGLYFCLSAIPSVIGGIFLAFESYGIKVNAVITGAVIHAFGFAITDGIRAALGIYLIVRSQKISEFWFKNEEE